MTTPAITQNTNSKEHLASTANTEPEAATARKLDNVLKLLDSEINIIISNQTRPGWTVWAILGGLSALTWLALEMIETKTPKWPNVLMLYLAWSLCVDGIAVLHSIPKSRSDSYRQTSRYRWANTVIEHKSPSLFLIFRHAGLIYLAYLSSANIGRPYTILLYCIYGGIGFLTLVMLPVGVFRFPIKTAEAQNPKVIAAVSVCLGMMITLLAFPYFKAATLGSTVTDYKLSLLLLASTVLISLLINKSNEPPLLSSLISLRRDLALGRINLDAGIAQFEIVLDGLKIADVLQEPVRKYLSIHDQIRDLCEASIDKLRAVAYSLPTNHKDISEQQRTIALAVIHSCTQHLTDMRQLFIDAGKEHKKLLMRMSLLRPHKMDQIALDSVNQRLSDSLKALQERLDILTNEWDTLIQLLQTNHTK